MSAYWPALDAAGWEETRATLHMWLQIVGKVRMALTPHINHWWEVPFYVTARGLTTSPMPHNGRYLQADFDFHDHQLLLQTSDGARRSVALEPRTVAEFYAATMSVLQALGVDVQIWSRPVEIADTTPFEENRHNRAYDADAVRRFWQALVQADRVLKLFRTKFLGKVSPVHFFWGAFDLAVTRFSGRPAPPHPGGIPNVGDWVMRAAYSHELSSAGWWPGDANTPPMFYAYAYPEPEGFKTYRMRPEAAFYSEEMGEFFLPYDSVRQAEDPDRTLLAFLESSYEAAAELAGWDREALERPRGWTPRDA